MQCWGVMSRMILISFVKGTRKRRFGVIQIRSITQVNPLVGNHTFWHSFCFFVFLYIDASAAFVELKEAYDILGNEQLRVQYAV